jgi:hypothetical protein
MAITSGGESGVPVRQRESNRETLGVRPMDASDDGLGDGIQEQAAERLWDCDDDRIQQLVLDISAFPAKAGGQPVNSLKTPVSVTGLSG